MEKALEVHNLSKVFQYSLKTSLAQGILDIAGEFGVMPNTRAGKEFYAIKDLSFDLEPGMCFGIVGSNGAGKTTLLKSISGLLKPDQGYVKYRGRLESLIALGIGSNPILTGRENIHILGSLRGIPKREHNKLVNRVVEFSDIGDFIDAPLQNYSSGMKARLAFGVAMNMDPDILLVDEVLAVGDAAFREKAAEQMRKLTSGGATVVLVSHNSVTMEKMCSQVLWMDRGEKKMIGDARTVIGAYEANAAETSITKAVEQVNSQKWKRYLEDLEVVRQGEELVIKGKVKESGHLIFVAEKPTGSGEPNRAAVGGGYFFGENPLAKRDGFEFRIAIDGFTPGSYRVLLGLMKNTTGQVGEKYLLPPTVVGSLTIGADAMLNEYQNIPATHVVNLMPSRNPEFIYRVNGQLVGKFLVENQSAR